MNVLVVEDDISLAAGLTALLKSAGYEVTHAATGEHARHVVLGEVSDLVILDLGLPDVDGLDLLRHLRGHQLTVPVLVLTARDGTEQQVRALDAGADDYMEKPFDLRALEARIRALLRRSYSLSGQIVLAGSMVLDPVRCEVSNDGKVEVLPAREYQVFETLVLGKGTVVSKERLAQRLNPGDDDIGTNAVEVYIHRLRRRLGPLGVGIRTVRGRGYSIDST